MEKSENVVGMKWACGLCTW